MWLLMFSMPLLSARVWQSRGRYKKKFWVIVCPLKRSILTIRNVLCYLLVLQLIFYLVFAMALSFAHKSRSMASLLFWSEMIQLGVLENHMKYDNRLSLGLSLAECMLLGWIWVWISFTIGQWNQVCFIESILMIFRANTLASFLRWLLYCRSNFVGHWTVGCCTGSYRYSLWHAPRAARARIFRHVCTSVGHKEDVSNPAW